MLKLNGPFMDLARHRSLVHELTKREIVGRYRGANFGLLWALISPFLMLAVYTLAFGGILGSHWPTQDGKIHSFALILFVGLIIHAFLAECINQSPQLVAGNPSYVKKVVFPLEILPWPLVTSALFHLAMNVVAYAVLALAMDQYLPWTIVLLPLAVLPLVILGLGVSWGLAALGVYFRDITQITGVASTALLFTSTAIIPVSAIPDNMRWLFMANPLSFIIDQARNVAVWGKMPDWQGLAIYALVALLVSYLGYGVFRATRRGFADVL
ncbi:ABC-2 type transporter [Pseudoxanthomonas spadix BD-a59]|uniref:Transport permease protein n=1 Tax=Pseudoxanthomonas spadix (strain BD-a59) TaxID=1045855 RepID=G7UVM1_PSEUP|nr:ABC transporter permease [Pseudoxanthomonas spadix]AER55138.1 ABC-2 type transporter [Pseudoxanthomonas spadix BD-a59]